MHFRIAVSFLFAVLFWSNGHSQSRLQLSYFGNWITHPGLRAGIEFDLAEKEVAKVREGKPNKMRLHQLMVVPSIGFFTHPGTQSALMLQGDLEYRRTGTRGGLWGASAGAGFMKTFIPNTFSVDENGSVEKVSAGHSYITTKLSLLAGKDLEAKRGIPLQVFAKPGVMLAMPNFPNNIGYFILELGVVYKLKGGGE